MDKIFIKKSLENYEWPIDKSWVENYIQIDEEATSFLDLQDGVLYYFDQNLGKIQFDFIKYFKQFKSNRASRGPLYNALKKYKDTTIIDATLGSGKDSCLLLNWGFKVTAYEIDPLIYLLLESSWQELIKKIPELKSRFTIKWGNYFVEQLDFNHIVYYDPMYPVTETSKKTALPRREIQFLRQHLTPNDDIEKNIQVAIKNAERLILKRSLHSKWTLKSALLPKYSCQGKNTRYDIFFE